MGETHRRQVTAGKESTTAREGRGSGAFGQQVGSQHRSRPRRGGGVGRRPRPPPAPTASPRPRLGPGEAAAPATGASRSLAGLPPRRPSVPRRRGRPACSLLPQPGPAAPRAAGPLTCTCLRKWHGPRTAGRQDQQQQEQRRRRRPRHLARGTVPGQALGSPSVRRSVSRSCLPYAASAAPRRRLLSARRFGQTSARLLVRTRRPGHRNTILPARPSAPPPPPPLPLNSSNGSSPAEPRARAAALPPP